MRYLSPTHFKYFVIGLALFFAFGSGLAVQSFFSTRNVKNQTETSPPTALPFVKTSPLPSSHTGARQENISTPTASSSARVLARVVRVIDGDTIEIEGGQKVRYIGVETPETVKPNTPVQCFGKEASSFNASLVAGKIVELEKDVSDTDRYGRLLRYVYVDTVFVNQTLVAQGYAYASSYPPDVKYQSLFTASARDAQESRAGLWGNCPVGSSSPTSSPNPVLGASARSIASPTVLPTMQPANISPSDDGTPPVEKVLITPKPVVSGCVIKGNISSSGKIYHLPGCASYDKTEINESGGERWFCTEEEAESSGWRKAKNC